MTGTSDTTLDLDEQLCFALHSASRRVVRAYTAALKPFGLTYTQYLVLLVLWEWHRDGYERPMVAAIGERLDLDSGTLTPLIRRMVSQDLVSKERQPDDERTVFVTLTKKGVALRRKVRNIPLAMLQQCSMPAPELTKLREQLKRL